MGQPFFVECSRSSHPEAQRTRISNEMFLLFSSGIKKPLTNQRLL